MNNLSITGLVELEHSWVEDLLPFEDTEGFINLFEVFGIKATLCPAPAKFGEYTLTFTLHVPFLLNALTFTLEDMSGHEFYMTFRLEDTGDELNEDQLTVMLYHLMHLVMYHDVSGFDLMKKRLMTGSHIEEGHVHWTQL